MYCVLTFLLSVLDILLHNFNWWGLRGRDGVGWVLLESALLLLDSSCSLLTLTHLVLNCGQVLDVFGIRPHAYQCASWVL